MAENKRVPSIRFAGFEQEWDKKQFDDVFDMITNNTLSRDNLNYIDGSTQNVHYGDILTVFGEYVDASIAELPFLNDEEIACKFQNAILNDGDIIIADTAEDEVVGKCVEIGNIGEKKILAGLHTIPCRPKEKFAPKYMGYYLNSDAYHQKLLPLMQGVKVIAISKSGVKGTEIIVSSDFKEQEKIGIFLSHLDEKIKQTEAKINRLMLLKQSMMIKMFPKEGESEPEIRFKGFSEDWEQRKLGEMMEVTSVKRIHQSDWKDSGVRFLRARDIVAKSKKENVNEPLFISQEKYDEYSAVSGKVKKGDLLVTGVGTIGVPMLVNIEEPLYFKDGNIIWFKNENVIDGRFFYYSFYGLNIQKFIKKSAGTGTVGTYTIENGKKTPINLPPKKDEQVKIGEYFSTLDHLITLHQQKLQKLKNMKSACMKRMFV